jgi:hypothetical protein
MVLQHLIDLPIRIHNEPKPKWIAGVRRNGLAVVLIQNVVSPTGFVALWSAPITGEMRRVVWV